MMPVAQETPVEPNSLLAEQAVVGVLLGRPELLNAVSPSLRPEDFYAEPHRIIYGAMLDMANAGEHLDFISLQDRLAQAKRLDKAGGPAYMGELAVSAPSGSNIDHHVALIRERSTRRKFIKAADNIKEMASSSANLAQGASLGIEELFKLLREGGALKEPVRLDKLLPAVFDGIERRSKGEINGLPTGFDDLDAHLMGGVRGGDLIIIAGRPSMGKAQPLSSKVLLKDGTWRAMGDLRLGDELASTDGKPSRVMGVYPQGEKEIFTVRFSDGRHTRACAEHLWRVMYRDWDEPRIINTDKLRAMLAKARYRNRLSVEMVSGAFGGGELPLDPYVLGVLLGDGGLKGATPRLTSADPEILSEVQAILGGEVELRKTGTYDYNLSSRSLPGRRVEDGCMLPYPRRYPAVYGDNEHRHFRPRTVYPVRDALDALGLLGKGSEAKFIPAAYLSASREDRLSLLQGLMDTDGWAEVHGSVRFSSCSRELSEGVETLVRSLGGTCSIVRKKTVCVSSGERRPGLDAWVCRIRHAKAETFFRLQRKSSRAVRVHSTVLLNVANIEPSGREQAQCIAVSHPSRLYVTDDYIVTHNTALGMQIAANVAMTRKPVMVFTLEMSQQQIAERTLAQIGGIEFSRIISGNLPDSDYDRMAYAVGKLNQIPLFIDDSGGMTVQDIAARARAQAKTGGLSMIVVDYLQIMGYAGRAMSRNDQLGEMSRQMKALAKELDVPFILLSQLNRDVEKRQDKRPVMADLRESGAIEQDADVIVMMYRDDYYYSDSEFKGMAEALIRKNRNGAVGSVGLRFEGEKVRFSNLGNTWSSPND